MAMTLKQLRKLVLARNRARVEAENASDACYSQKYAVPGITCDLDEETRQRYVNRARDLRDAERALQDAVDSLAGGQYIVPDWETFRAAYEAHQARKADTRFYVAQDTDSQFHSSPLFRPSSGSRFQ